MFLSYTSSNSNTLCQKWCRTDIPPLSLSIQIQFQLYFLLSVISWPLCGRRFISGITFLLTNLEKPFRTNLDLYIQFYPTHHLSYSGCRSRLILFLLPFTTIKSLFHRLISSVPGRFRPLYILSSLLPTRVEQCVSTGKLSDFISCF